MVYKESLLRSWGSAFGCKSAELLLTCLINMLPESFGALSLCLSNPTKLGGKIRSFVQYILSLRIYETAKDHIPN
jgi:hypothetical protein